ncbi:TPA: Asp-tRNA(Asn)/Glu-tRNA(Gln) amidotransferase GatCAB subunit C, partial [Candidatus Galligastranaerophilus gallistercoris]|nr:Asp-tRNA(Asn)/Glu-tRNA(Gln) amidotransferase GatCAB subunit C [Candidatus Galligastranaerophilus gallistercoris]
MELAYKKQNCTDLSEANIGSQAVLAGWASTIRDLGGIIFVEMRDRSGLFQVVADPQINPQVYETFQKLKTEYVIQVKGNVSKRPEDTINEKLKTG